MILHIDMDAFYASVEQLDNPDLQGKCVIVGGDSMRGVVSAASYEARRHGVRSAMPVFKAKQKCPHGIFVAPRMARYKEISVIIMSLLREFTPLVEPVSIDEAYMDISGCERLFGGPDKIGLEIKKRIKKTVHLSCSVGIAPNKFLAKIASDMDKPDGLTIVTPEDTMAFVESLPIRKVPGVGKSAHKQLMQIGIQTLGDVKNYPQQILIKRLGKFGQRLLELAFCQDQSPVTPESQPKSISRELTLTENTNDPKLLCRHFLKHAERIARDLRRHGVRAKTVSIKIKHADFKQATRSVTLASPTQSTKTIYAEAVKLLDAYRLKTKIRLIGVGTSNLVPAATPRQASLFENQVTDGVNWEQVDKAVDSIHERFGRGVIKRASLTDTKCLNS